MQRAADITGELHWPRRIEAKLMAKLLAFGLGHRLSHDLTQRVAEAGADSKSNDQNSQHDEQGLGEAAPEKGNACGERFYRGHAGRLCRPVVPKHFVGKCRWGESCNHGSSGGETGPIA